MGVAFRELPGGRSRWRLPQSRDRGLRRSTHCGYCVHGTHLLPMDHDHWNASTPATRCAAGIMPVAVSLPNAPPTATPSSVMGRQGPPLRSRPLQRPWRPPSAVTGYKILRTARDVVVDAGNTNAPHPPSSPAKPRQTSHGTATCPGSLTRKQPHRLVGDGWHTLPAAAALPLCADPGRLLEPIPVAPCSCQLRSRPGCSHLNVGIAPRATCRYTS
jgi:hypothetical protein